MKKKSQSKPSLSRERVKRARNDDPRLNQSAQAGIDLNAHPNAGATRIPLATYKKKRGSQSLFDLSSSPSTSPTHQSNKSIDEKANEEPKEGESDYSSSGSEFSHEQFMAKYKKIKAEKQAIGANPKRRQSDSLNKGSDKVSPIRIDLKNAKVKVEKKAKHGLFPMPPTRIIDEKATDENQMQNNGFDDGSCCLLVLITFYVL